ncbi:MAG: PKD domain-containing protein [Bacteroidales bacterium]|nr:PKD domain-containing protein [Bacteroidales bacterium]
MRYSITIFVLLFVLAISCTKKEKEITYNPAYEYPIAAFTYSGNDGPAPVTIQFANYSETIHIDSVRYLWVFGEGGEQSTDKNPTHTFYNTTINDKNVLVKLTVFDLISDLSQTKSQNIVIANQ